MLRADFFLTDGRGLVTRWGARPARAFARKAEDVIGRPAFEVVVAGAGKWKRHLAGDGDRPRSRVAGTAVDGGFEVELLVLPVPQSDSLEMSRLLEALGSDPSSQGQLAKLERDHAGALKVLRDPPSSGSLAGLVVAYTAPDRPQLPQPVVGEPEEKLSRLGELEREIEELRERADAAMALAEHALALVGHRPAAAKPPAASAEGQPCATIALDGRFESINPAFESLVGYSEEDFRHARWPSVADREKITTHRALLTRLATGEIEDARVETVYMHGQGLTVPVKGTLQLVRAEDGSPRHLELSVDP